MKTPRIIASLAQAVGEPKRKGSHLLPVGAAVGPQTRVCMRLPPPRNIDLACSTFDGRIEIVRMGLVEKNSGGIVQEVLACGNPQCKIIGIGDTELGHRWRHRQPIVDDRPTFD